MKRTKPIPSVASAKKRKNSKQNTLPDGRLLGEPAVDSVPKKQRNVIPTHMAYDEDAGHSKPKKNKRAPKDEPNWMSPCGKIHRMCRTLMPLALETDGEVELAGKRTRIRGLNQNRLNVLVSAFQNGMTQRGACQLAGISETTYRDWMLWGEQGRIPYNIFYHTMIQTHAEYENKLIMAILAAGTEREEYEEVTKKQELDPATHELVTVERKIASKFKHPRFEAALALLERKFPEWRLDRADQNDKSTVNSGEDDLLAMDAVTTGGINSINKEVNDAD